MSYLVGVWEAYNHSLRVAYSFECHLHILFIFVSYVLIIPQKRFIAY